MSDIYDQWQEGDITADEALNQLCQQLVSLEDRLEPLEATRLAIRNQLSVVVEQLGGKAELAGFGTLHITQASLTANYDTRQLDALITRLSTDYPAIAQAIADCRRESSRTGGLRITRAKQHQ